MAVFISKNSRVKGSSSEPQHIQLQQNRVWVPPQGNPLPPPGADPPNNHPHIPPPLPFPAMAAFQRRREDWGGGGGGFGMLGVLPPPPRGPPDIIQQPVFHGAQNPNIQDVQRLNLRSGQLRGGSRANPPEPQASNPQSLNLSPRLNPQGAAPNFDAGSSRPDAQSGQPNAGEGVSFSASDSERPGPSNAEVSQGALPEPGTDSLRPRSGSSDSSAVGSGSGSGSHPNMEVAGAQAPRPGFPSIRPNAMHNRQRQLDMLRKHEDRLRSRNSNNSHNKANNSRSVDCLPRNPMVIHVLDISEVTSTGTVTWLPTRDTPIPGAPEETIFYSLVEGRGELVMFGGIQRDQNPMQRVNSPPDSGSHIVSNGLFIISPMWLRRV